MRNLTDIIAGRRVIADVDGAFGRTRVIDARHPGYGRLRILDVEGTWQSGCYTDERWSELAFEYHRRIAEALFCSDAPALRHLLVLGGGGMSLPRYVVTHCPGTTVEVVEADQVVITLAHRHFFLDALTREQAGRLTIVCDDAGARLAQIVRDAADGEAGFDAIVNDAFAAERVPESLRGTHAAQLLRAALVPRGLYLANVISALSGADATPLRDATAALAQSFAHVWVVPLGADEPEEPDNNVVIATDSPYVPPGALSTAELWGTP